MQRKTTVTGIATTIAAIVLALFSIKAALSPARSPGGQSPDSGDVSMEAGGASSQLFEDLQIVSQHFADELGRLKEKNQTVSPAELADQADRDNTYPFPTRADPGKKLDTESIYTRAKPGVVVIGGIHKCTKCNHWHIQCGSGFVVGQDGLILTTLDVVEGFKKLDALGIMTEDGRVFPVKAVLASSHLNDLALLKVDAQRLRPLPVSHDVSVGATVYCLSHPVFPSGTGNCFYTFSPGVVCGKYTLHTGKRQPLKVLAVTADYGPGSSGGPILNDRGSVVAVACQAMSRFPRDHEKESQMSWKFGRPSASILALLSPSAAKPASTASKKSVAAGQAVAKVASPAPPVTTAPADSTTVTFSLHPSDQTALGYYRPVQVKLTEEPPIKPKAEPKYASKKPLYGVLQLGVGQNSRFLVALDEPNDGKPKIYIDGNGDGDLNNSGPGNWDRSQGGNYFVGNVAIDVPYAKGRIPYKFCFYRMKNRQPDRLFYYRVTGREGEVVLDGNRYRVLVLDDNADGRFDDLKNGSLIIDLNQDRQLEASPDSAEYFPLHEPFNVRGKVWEVASLSPDGLSIALRPSKAKVPIKPYLTPGYPAPEFTAHGLDGKSIDLKAEASKGHYVLLDFWASWCGPCRREFSTLRRVHAQYKDHGLTVIGVNLDSEQAKAIEAAQQADLLYPHVFDGQGWKNAVALLYRVHGIPQVYLLDSQLKIVAKNLRGAQLEMRLRELLGPGDEKAAGAVDKAK
jgi:thiol-disulfide isomerase/thioredoxin/S1-C subfamily serine protease